MKKLIEKSSIASLLAIALLLSITLLPLSLQANTFTFTAIPDEDESRLQQRFGKVAAYLSELLDIPVKYIPVKSYSAAISAFRAGHVQLVWFGGLSGVRARKMVPGSEVLAQGYEDQFFKTLFITHHSAGISVSDNFPKAIQGKTFTFGSKGSTSGRLMPEFYIRQYLQKTPQQAFSRVGFSGDHSRTIAQVQVGAYQVGVVNYKVWEKQLAEGLIDPTKVKVVWTTPSYPDYQWTIRGDVDQQFTSGLKEKVRAALLTMNSPELLASFPRQSFVAASNSDYQRIEQTARDIGLLD